MKTLAAILLSLFASTAVAQSDIDIAMARALAIAKAKAQQTATVPCDAQASQMAKDKAPKPALQGVWNANLQTYVTGDGNTWDAANGRWLSADGKKWAKAGAGANDWQPRQWRDVPDEYRTEYYNVKICRGRGLPCEIVTRSKKVLVNSAHREEVIAPPAQAADPSLPADQQPTPMTGVGAGLKALAPRADEVLVDFGCGADARWLITAVREYGVNKAIGVEIDPAVAAEARRYVAQAGYSDKIEIRDGDSTKIPLTANVGVAYMWPEVLAQLVPQIKKLDRFVSYGHAVPGLSMRQVGDLYVYEKPRPVALIPAKPLAVWGNGVYSHPVCNNPRCTMCNSIRAQLAGVQ